MNFNYVYNCSIRYSFVVYVDNSKHVMNYDFQLVITAEYRRFQLFLFSYSFSFSLFVLENQI